VPLRSPADAFAVGDRLSVVVGCSAIGLGYN